MKIFSCIVLLCILATFSFYLLLVRSVPFLSFIVSIFAWNVSFGISDFLEEISSLSHSVVFLYFFALITEEGFLISPCYSLELCIQMGISFFFSFAFSFSSFHSICKASSDNHLAFSHFLFLRKVSIPASCTMSWISIHSSSGTLSDLIPGIYLSFPLYNHNGFDLGHTWKV